MGEGAGPERRRSGSRAREKKEWEPGPREEGVGAGPERIRSGSRGPREERGSKGTSTKRRGTRMTEKRTLSQ